MTNFPNNFQKIATKACGPISLCNIYTHFNISKTVEDIYQEMEVTSADATYLSQLATNCVKNGLETNLISSNPNILSPDWNDLPINDLLARLKKWIALNVADSWARSAIYLSYYVEEGGKISIANINKENIDKYLEEGRVILVCVNDSWLWGKRKLDNVAEYDDIKGKGRGHFVVVYGKNIDNYLISDPYPTGIPNRNGLYEISKDTLITATLVWNPEMLVVGKK